MAVQLQDLMDDLNQRQALVAEKYKADPLPSTDKEARLRLEGEIAKHGLAQHVVELETQGYTILPPGVGAPMELVDRVRNAILRVAEQREQRKITGTVGPGFGAGRQYYHLLPEDPVFEEAVMAPAMLTLVTYLCGYRAKLNLTTGIVKTNESEAPLAFHTDISSLVPPPWPAHSWTTNVNWLLTDYNRENGALCVVPGSHLWRKPPPPEFLMAHDHPDVKVVTAPAGSMVVWHSGLWHGALPRTAEGKRILLILLYSRAFFQGTEPFWLSTTKEMIERNPARFGVLAGLQELDPWGARGPRMDLFVARCRDMGKWT